MLGRGRALAGQLGQPGQLEQGAAKLLLHH